VKRASRSGSVHRTFLIAVLVSALAGAGGLAAVASEQQAVQAKQIWVEGNGSYTDVTAAGLARMLAKKNFPLINVHSPYEGEIDGTDLFIPFDQVNTHQGQLPPDKKAPIVLYCRSGHMSAIAAETLVKRGFTNVWNLDGGMVAWEKAGYLLTHRGR